MEMDWTAAGIDTLNLGDVNALEDAMSVLLYTTLRQESESDVGLLADQNVLTVDTQVQNVVKTNNANNNNSSKNEFTMRAVVDILYVENKDIGAIEDMASVLTQFAQQEQLEQTLADDMDTILGGMTSSISLKFRSMDDDQTRPVTTMLYETTNSSEGSNALKEANMILIIACSILGAALVFMSVVLLYVVGGWRDLRQRLQDQIFWIKQQHRTYSSDAESETPDEESGIDVADSGDADDCAATNPSGILGASASEEYEEQQRQRMRTAGLGIHSTPERGIDGDAGYDTTPFSEMSQYTDTSRVPLGIASMRKMQQSADGSSLPPLAFQ